MVPFLPYLLCATLLGLGEPARASSDRLNPASKRGNSVRVVSSSSSRLVLEFETLEYESQSIEEEGETWLRISASGCGLMAQEGRPQLPIRGVIFGVPPEGRATLRVLDSHYRIAGNDVRIYPTPKLSLAGEGRFPKPEFEFTLDKDFYQRGGLYPRDIAFISGYGMIRDHRVGRLEIHPFRLNLANGDLRVYDRIRVEITLRGGVAGAKVRKRLDPFDSVLKGILINYQEAKGWVRERATPEWQPPPLGDSPRWKIFVSQDGIYHIDYETLSNAGIDPTVIDPKTIKIENGGVELPIWVEGEHDHSFDPGDYIDFYGEFPRGEYTHFDPYSSEGCYWLSYGGNKGVRMVAEDGYPHDTAGVMEPSTYTSSHHFETDSLFREVNLSGCDTLDFWFWDRVSAPQLKSYPIQLVHADTSAGQGLSFRIMLHGLTYAIPSPSHHAILYLNGSLVADTTWDGQIPCLVEVEASPTILRNGQNLFELHLPGDVPSGVDAVLLNWVELDYPKLYRAEEDLLHFSEPQGENYQFTLQGFSYPVIDVYKIGVSKIVNTVVRSSNGDYEIVFQDEPLQPWTRYVAVSSLQKLRPVLTMDGPSDLRNPVNAAEYVVITSGELSSVAKDYARWRREGGLSTFAVEVEDIYDEFNHGNPSPFAVRDFIRYAYDQWQTPPTYCLLLGDGSYDYRDLLGYGGGIVPPHLFWLPGYGPLSDDNFYACLSGEDLLPDILIGRIPVRTEEEFEAVMDKIVTYENRPNLDEWRRRAVFAADSHYVPGFAQSEGIIADFLYQSWDAARVYGGVSWREDLIRELDEGGVILNYIGHGGGDCLGYGHFFRTRDIPRLSNSDRLPFAMSYSCYNGFFDQPDARSMGEEFLMCEGVGAIGYIGCPGPSYGDINLHLDRGIFEGFFTQELRRLGEAVAYGKFAMFAANIGYWGDVNIKSYNLLGDPALRVAFPQEKVSLSVEPRSASPGDSILLSGNISQMSSGEAKVTLHDPEGNPFQKLVFPVSNDSFEGSFVIPDTLNPGDGPVKVYCYSLPSLLDGAGWVCYSVENPNIWGLKTIPDSPSWLDSVWVEASISDPQGLDSTYCEWTASTGKVANWQPIPMVLIGGDTYRTSSPIPPGPAGTIFSFRVVAVDGMANRSASPIHSYPVGSADLQFIGVGQLGGVRRVLLEVEVFNAGGMKADSFSVDFHFLSGTDTLLLGRDTLSLPPYTTGVAQIGWSLPPDSHSIWIAIDPEDNIPEADEANNDALETILVDRFQVTPQGGTAGGVFSVDRNLLCEILPGSVSDSIVLSIEEDTLPTAWEQPDFSPAALPGSPAGGGYLLSLADSTDTLKESMALIMWFDPSDSINQHEVENLRTYRWSVGCGKWISLGGTPDSNSISITTEKLGLFTIGIDRDDTPPQFTSRVENPEYLRGTVYSEMVRLSSVVEDRNGIDLVDHSILVFLDGDSVVSEDYTYSVNPTNANQVPLVYQTLLQEGPHEVAFSAWDCSGNQGTDTLSFTVRKVLGIEGLGNYPNPVTGDQTIFTYTLTSDCRQLTLKIYTTSGRLIKTFERGFQPEGYYEIVWDTVSEMANGVYYWRIRAEREGMAVERTMKMAVLR